jgi:hypothetical protein
MEKSVCATFGAAQTRIHSGPFAKVWPPDLLNDEHADSLRSGQGQVPVDFVETAMDPVMYMMNDSMHRVNDGVEKAGIPIRFGGAGIRDTAEAQGCGNKKYGGIFHLDSLVVQPSESKGCPGLDADLPGDGTGGRLGALNRPPHRPNGNIEWRLHCAVLDILEG